MTTQIQLNDEKIRDFQVLRDLGAESISSIVKHLEGLTSVPLKPSQLFEALKKSIGANEEAAVCLMRQALSLNGLMRKTNLGVDEILAGIRAAIERNSQWTSEEIEDWKSVEPAFRDILDTNAFRLVAATIDLSYEYANLFRNARILTDIRPLFTNSADEIEGAVVSQTLRIRYDSVEGDHELCIAMDEEDVRNLSEQCERALKKSVTAREMMNTKAGISTIVSGESSDA